MDFTYENQGSNTYLVYTIREDDVIDSLGLGMLTNNKISGLARCLFVQMDATKYIKYNVSAKVPVSQFFSERINRKRLVGVFSGINDGFLSMEDYMMDPNHVVLDLDKIFSDVSTFETVMIYLPVENSGNEVDLGEFFKEIMFRTQFDQTENCDYVAKIINYLNSAPTFSPYDFKRVLDEIKDIEAKTQHQPQQSAPVAQRVPPVTPQPEFIPVVQQNAQNLKTVPPVLQQATAQTPQVSSQQVQIPQTTPDTPALGDMPVSEPEKKISLFYLLQHYNKENAALYKAQKAAKKQNAGTKTASKEKKKKKSKQTQHSGSGMAQSAFAIPGQSVPKNELNNHSASFQTPPPAAQQTPPSAPAPQEQPLQNTQKSVSTQTVPQNMEPQFSQVNFGETTYLNRTTTIAETSLLRKKTDSVQSCPHLIRVKTNERIDINKTPFRIGKEKSYVDYCVRDNAAVSRSHAVIESKDGIYVIVDTNSTNHTYVNGEMILSNTEVQLLHGTRLRIANEDFEFKLY